MRPMSWDKGSQLQHDGPVSRLQPSVHRPEIGVDRVEREGDAFRRPVLPDVNCTNLPGASRAAGAPEVRRFAEGMDRRRGHRTEGRRAPHRTTDVSRRYGRTCRRSGSGTRPDPSRGPDGVARRACNPSAARRRTWRGSRGSPSRARPPCRLDRPGPPARLPPAGSPRPTLPAFGAGNRSERQWTRARPASGTSSASRTRLIGGRQYRFASLGRC